MIPKTIHYCWFGGGKKPYLIRKCIKSWHRIMPDYEIKEWNESNFDISMMQFTCDAYARKKWAFVADVCRFYVCYTEGGIYLDTDVEVFKRFDSFLNNDFYIGTEVQNKDNKRVVWLDGANFGCIKGHWLAKKCLEIYETSTNIDESGNFSSSVVEKVVTDALIPHGYVNKDICQNLDGVQVYSSEYFTNKTNYKEKDSDVFSLHHFDGSWTDKSNRGMLYKICARYDLLKYYSQIEQLMTIFHKS